MDPTLFDSNARGRLLDLPPGIKDKLARILSLRCLVLWVCFGAGAAIAQEAFAAAGGEHSGNGGYQRWAVLSSEAIEKTGLAGLLTAALSGRDFELVERDELRLATAELELSALFGSAAASERLKLGRLVKADALILLSLEKHEKERFVKLVISDCRYGARLRLEYVPYSAARLDAICHTCVSLVDQTRRHFAEGIRQLIGVAHWLSKNLVHDHDHLQAGYAYLLETALMGFPGVAVIETEEGRAICRELDLAGGELEDRVVPLFAAGEYDVSAAKPGAEPTVRLAVRVSDGRQLRMEFARKGLSISAVPELLRGTIASQIVRLSREGAQPGLSRRQQYTMLTERAEAFSRFGGYEHSTGLREAALLLEPGDVDQRLALIGDYLRRYHVFSESLFKRSFGDAQTEAAGDNGPQRRDDSRQVAFRERLLTFHLLARHVEELIRRRGLNPHEAGHLVDHLGSRMLKGGYLTDPRHAEELKEAADAFLWRVYPHFPDLDYDLREGRVGLPVCQSLQIPADVESDPRSVIRQYMDWTRRGLRLLCHDCPRIGSMPGRAKPDDRRTLDNLYRFLTEVAKRPIPLSCVMALVTREPPWDLNSMIKAGRLEVDDVRRFYERLKETGQPVNVVYGRVGLLALRLYTLRDPSIGPEAIEEVDRLLQAVVDGDAGQPDYPLAAAYCKHHFDRLREDITKTLGTPPQGKRHPLPENSIAETRAAWGVAFEPVEGVKADWRGLFRCTESLDVAWSGSRVDVIAEEGALREVFRLDGAAGKAPPEDSIYSAHWDGENIWIACAVGGIYVVSPQGTVRGHIDTQQGLPPRDTTPLPRVGTNAPPLMLHPIEPGRCIALGRFGKHRRVWIAEVAARQAAPDGPSFAVDVFHTATKTPQPAGADPQDDPHVIFAPAWLLGYTYPAKPHQRWLLVGRQVRGPSEFNKGRRPLAINLETLEVTSFPARFHLPGYNWNPRHAVGGHVVYVAAEGIELFSPPERGIAGDWRPRSLVEFEPFRRPKLRPMLLQHQGMLYNPGAEWRRIDPGTWNVERLQSPTMPYQDPFECYGVSARYGLVAWNVGGQLYRVSIDSRPSAAEDLAALYPYVPPARRPTHHRAVRAIQSLGGSVDTRWGLCPHTFPWPRAFGQRPDFSPDTFQWRTIVYLPKGWKGGDAGLAHLKDLYHLRDLYLVRAQVSDEGLRAVSRIGSLESLYLVETRASDAGLAHLQGLDQLVYLRLEGTVGRRELSDVGLKRLGELPRLEKLALYGDGFTEAGLVTLEALPKLRELWLLDTRITESALSKLTASRGGDLQCHQDRFKQTFD